MGSFLADPYDFLFERKMLIFFTLVGLTLMGLSMDIFQGKARSVKETFSNLAIFFGNNAVNLWLGQALQLFVLGWLQQFAFYSVPVNGASLALCLLGVDFCYYWRHRWEHEVGLLWAEHSVHHSSEEYNFATSVRLPVVTPLFGWIFFAPLALIGFPAKLIAASFLLDLFYQYGVHNDEIGRLGFLERFLSTPSNHRVHHAKNPLYLDKNYGGVLILWDRIFGTYEPEVEKPEFGIVVPIGTRNPFLINARPFARLYQKWNAKQGVREKCEALFGRP